MFISALGKIADAARLLPNEWKSPGHLLVRIGPDSLSLAGTVAARLTGSSANDVDELSPTTHREFLLALQSLPHGLLHSGLPIDLLLWLTADRFFAN